MSSPAVLFIFNVALITFVLSKRVAHKFPSGLHKLVGALSILSLTALLAAPAAASTITEYRLEGTPTPWGIAISGGSVWYIERGNNRIARLSGSSLNGWAIPTVGSQPWGIVMDPNGNPWFTESLGNKITKLDFAANQMFEWTLPSTDPREPRGIVWNQSSTSPDLWYTEYMGNRIGHLHATGSGTQVVFSSYQISTADTRPLSIALSPVDRSIVWWTEYSSSRIGSLRLLDNGTALFRHYSITSGSGPWGIAVDPSGYVWVTENQKSSIGRLNPSSGEYVTFKIPTDSAEPREIAIEVTTATPASIVNIWFTEYNKDKIGKYVPGTNVFFEYPIISAGGRPHGIALASGGTPDVWFTEPFAEKIGRLTQSGGPSTTTSVNTITSAVTTSSTVTVTRPQTTSSAATISIGTAGVGVVGSAITTSSMITITDTVSMMRATTTSIVSATQTSTTTSSTTTTSTTTNTGTSTIVSTLWFDTTTTTTLTSVKVESFTASTSITQTILQVSTSPTTSTTTAASTFQSPTVTVTVANTSYLSTTTFSPTVTIASTFTSLSTLSTSITMFLTSTTTLVTTQAITRPCIIASAAYGSEMAKEVESLRNFRDMTIMQTFAGQQFMEVFNRFYYSFSPTVARLVSSSEVARFATRILIYPLISILDYSRGLSSNLTTHPEEAAVISGLASGTLIGLVYLLLPIMTVRIVARQLVSRRLERGR